jgi:hypothetical protein
MAGKSLREYAVGLVGPAAVVLDDLVDDFGHGFLPVFQNASGET